MKHLGLIMLLYVVGCSQRNLKVQIQECFDIARRDGTTESVNNKLKELVPIGSPAYLYEGLFATADKIIKKPDETVYIFDNGTGAHLAQGLVIMITIDVRTERIKKVVAALAAM